MKKKYICWLRVLTLILFLSFNWKAPGQPPPPPGGHGLNGNQGSGGAAPIDGGSLILLLSSLGYGSVKVIRAFCLKNNSK